METTVLQVDSGTTTLTDLNESLRKHLQMHGIDSTDALANAAWTTSELYHCLFQQYDIGVEIGGTRYGRTPADNIEATWDTLLRVWQTAVHQAQHLDNTEELTEVPSTDTSRSSPEAGTAAAAAEPAQPSSGPSESSSRNPARILDNHYDLLESAPAGKSADGAQH